MTGGDDGGMMPRDRSSDDDELMDEAEAGEDVVAGVGSVDTSWPGQKDWQMAPVDDPW